MNKFKLFLIRKTPKPVIDKIVQVKDLFRTLPSSAIINNQEFTVQPEKFWISFNKGKWEPELISFLKKNIKPGMTIIDIGSWIGPSILTAYAYGANKIIAVEADSENFKTLQANCRANKIEDVVELHNICISNETGKLVNFGQLDSIHHHSSTRGITNTNGVAVSTLSFEDFIQKIDMDNTNIIKIDIEGAERLLLSGLKSISAVPCLNIYLALHPPFWPDKKRTSKDLIQLFEHFDLYDNYGKPLALHKLEELLLSKNKSFFKDKSGIFIDVILKTKMN